MILALLIIAIALLIGALAFIRRKPTAIPSSDSSKAVELNSEEEHPAETKGSSSNNPEETIDPNTANSPEEELRHAANLVVKYSFYATTSSLSWELGVDEQRAEAILSELERLGIVGPKNPLNSRA